ncbi:MAG: hypothetical protein WD512_12340 [Candidatus Paceibacterota bacterium]
MTQLPLLVDNLINWYIWKAKITNVNDEYWDKIDYHSQYNTDKLVVEDDTYYFYDKYPADVIMKVQYRSLDEPVTNINYHFFIYRYEKLSGGIQSMVALLPLRYYYSSGSSNPEGFLSEAFAMKNDKQTTRPKHYWLPDFVMLYENF